MANREFIYWCRDAISGIRYWKYRNRVYTELYGHLEDRYEDFLRRGCEPKEAEKKTLESMGNALELAPYLAQIHKPHWAYAAIATRIVATALLFVCLGKSVDFFLDVKLFRPSDVWDPFSRGGEVCISHLEPEVSRKASGYTFTVEEAALWRTFYSEPTDKGDYFDSLFLRLKVKNPLPWMREQTAVRNMWAVDSNGTYYKSFENSLDADNDQQPWVSYNVYETGIGTYEYVLNFQDPSENMEWVELHYDRDGQDLVLRVTLTGGEES